MKKIIIEIDLDKVSEVSKKELLGDDGIHCLSQLCSVEFTEKTENFKTKTLTYKMQSVNN